MDDNRYIILDQQVSFLEAPINSRTTTVHRWRRDHIAYLLKEFKEKLKYDDNQLQRLFNERETLEGELSEAFSKLEVSQKNANESRKSLEVVQHTLKSAQELAKERLDAEIAARQKEKLEQIEHLNGLQSKYEARIAAFEEKMKEMETQNNKLKMISTQAIKYITDDKNRGGFFYFLQMKGIVMDVNVFNKYMDDLNEMTSEQLLLSFESGFLSLLEDIELPGGKTDDIPPLPTAEVVFPIPITEIKKEGEK